MELVRPHDAVDLVPPAIRVEAGDAGPETGDLQHHLGTVAEQELEVVGCLMVPPDVVEDGCVNVPLVVAEVPVPVPRPGIEMHDLSLLLSVAAALPGVHGSPVAGFFGCCAGLIQPSVAIHEQLACDLGQPEVEERVDVELVPKDVPAVSLAVKAAGRNPGVEVGRVRRADLQDVGNVQADQKLNTLVPGDPHVAGGPQLVPRPCVMVEGLGERLAAVDGLYGGGQRLAYCMDARSAKGQLLVDVVLHLVEAAVYVYHPMLSVDPGTRRLGYIHVRLTGLRPERDDVRTYGAGQFRVQVAAFELPVADDAPISNPAVQRREHRHLSRPVLRRDRPLDRPLVHVGHADEAAAEESSLAARPVAKPQGASDRRVAEVQLVSVGE